MKKTLFLPLLFLAFASCSNDPEETATAGAEQPVVCATVGDADINLAAEAVDRTVRFVIDGRIVYSGESVWLRNGTYEVYMQFLAGNEWSNLHVAVCSATGSIGIAGLNARSVSVSGSGTLTIVQPEPYTPRAQGTIYINSIPDTIDYSVKFVISNGSNRWEVFGNEPVSLPNGEYKAYMLFDAGDGKWAVTRLTQYETTGDISFNGLYDSTLHVSGSGSLTVTQIVPGDTPHIKGTLFINL